MCRGFRQPPRTDIEPKYLTSWRYTRLWLCSQTRESGRTIYPYTMWCSDTCQLCRSIPGVHLRGPFPKQCWTWVADLLSKRSMAKKSNVYSVAEDCGRIPWSLTFSWRLARRSDNRCSTGRKLFGVNRVRWVRHLTEMRLQSYVMFLQTSDHRSVAWARRQSHIRKCGEECHCGETQLKNPGNEMLARKEARRSSGDRSHNVNCGELWICRARPLSYRAWDVGVRVPSKRNVSLVMTLTLAQPVMLSYMHERN